MFRSLLSVSIASAGLLALTSTAPANALDGDYLRIASGDVNCYVTSEHVACETGGNGFLNAPLMEGSDQHIHIASMNADGELQWVVANLGGSENQNVLEPGPPLKMYGWTILANSDGTLFSNDETENGLFVTAEIAETR